MKKEILKNIVIIVLSGTIVVGSIAFGIVYNNQRKQKENLEQLKEEKIKMEEKENIFNEVIEKQDLENKNIQDEKDKENKITQENKPAQSTQNQSNTQSSQSKQENVSSQSQQESSPSELQQESTPTQPKPSPEKPTTLQITTNPIYTFIEEGGGYYHIRTSIDVTNNANWNLAHLSIRATIYSDTGSKVGEIRMFDSPLKSGETRTMYSSGKVSTSDVTNTNFTYELTYPNWWYEGDAAQKPESGGW